MPDRMTGCKVLSAEGSVPENRAKNAYIMSGTAAEGGASKSNYSLPNAPLRICMGSG